MASKKTTKKTGKTPKTKATALEAAALAASEGPDDTQHAVKDIWSKRSPANREVASGPAPSKKLAKLRALRGQINEHAGVQIIGFAEETAASFLLRRPSGITSLDIATGGGLPAGCPVEISGPEGAGKTYLAMQYMLMHQLLYGSESAIAYACTEPTKGFDFRRAAKMGLKLGLPPAYIEELEKIRQLEGKPPFTSVELTNMSEKVGEFMVIQAATGEQVFTALLSCVESNEFGIIIIDSITSVLPEANADRELEDPNKIGARAMLVTNFISKYTPMTNKFGTPHRTTLIGIGQARAKQNRQSYEKEWETPAAYAWKHGVQLRIQVQNGQKLKKTYRKVEGVYGKEVKWVLTKGKAGAHEHMQGSFEFYFDDVFPDLNYPYGSDRCDTLLTACMSAGIVCERSGEVYIVDCDGLVLHKNIPSIGQLKGMLDSDFDFELQLRRTLLQKIGVACLYRE